MGDNKVKLLIVEDDKEIRELLGAFLTDNGYEISYATNGIEATNKFTPEYDLVLLDIMLPFKSGEQVLTDIRKTSDVPVIIISAKDMIQTKIDVIRMGADDYITKPFDLGEVLVRIEAMLRRTVGKTGDNQVITHKNLTLNRKDGRVFIKGEQISLTTKEYAILELLLSYPDKMFSKSNIFESIWNEDFDIYDDNALKVHMSNLRAKLKKYDDEEYIETIWGMGYRLAK
jgi:DNA-binding response OmpR family regulator